jgi:hypothetical protein
LVVQVVERLAVVAMAAAWMRQQAAVPRAETPALAV